MFLVRHRFSKYELGMLSYSNSFLYYKGDDEPTKYDSSVEFIAKVICQLLFYCGHFKYSSLKEMIRKRSSGVVAKNIKSNTPKLNVV